MTQRPIIQSLLVALSCWMLLQLIIRFLGFPVGVIVVVVSGLMICTIYGLRFEPRQLRPIKSKTAGRYWIQFVARVAKLQEAPTNDPLEGLNLKSAEDFVWFRERLHEEVFGHNDALDGLTAELQKNALLRARSESKADLPPLGVILLAGNRGTGKRYLANCISRRLFERPMVTVIDLRHCPDGDAVPGYLFGTPGNDGVLIKPVRLSPCQVIVLESVEVAGTKLQEALKNLFVHGRCVDGARGGIVSFEKCVFVLTTTAVPEGLLKEESFGRDRLIDALNETTALPPALLDCASVCAVLRPAGDLVKAQVIVQLMVDECRRYRLNLDYVEPEIVAREVDHFSETAGFEYSRIRIARWISDPIHLAVQHGMDSLVLTTDLVDQEVVVTPSISSHQPVRQPQAVLTESLTK